MAIGTRTDPYNGYNFIVQLEGLTVAGFKSASGLDQTVATVPYREGSDKPLNQRQLRGLVTYSNITLTRGITDDHSLFDWHMQVVDGTLTRKNVSVMLYDNTNTIVKIQWNLINCWPTKWSGPSFDAASDAI